MALALQYELNTLEAGLDEAGRGCLAGPVVAAAVILPPNFSNEMLNDSKQLSEKKRDLLRIIIMEHAIAWKIAVVSPQRIDKINILKASWEAMEIAWKGLHVAPESLLVDGNRFRKQEIPYECMIKGDGRFMNIAAASILAKTERDLIMKKLHGDFPDYNWKQNKGYPTRAHRETIMRIGTCIHHRKTFKNTIPPKLF